MWSFILCGGGGRVRRSKVEATEMKQDALTEVIEAAEAAGVLLPSGPPYCCLGNDISTFHVPRSTSSPSISASSAKTAPATPVCRRIMEPVASANGTCNTGILCAGPASTGRRYLAQGPPGDVIQSASTLSPSIPEVHSCREGSCHRPQKTVTWGKSQLRVSKTPQPRLPAS